MGLRGKLLAFCKEKERNRQQDKDDLKNEKEKNSLPET